MNLRRLLPVQACCFHSSLIKLNHPPAWCFWDFTSPKFSSHQCDLTNRRGHLFQCDLEERLAPPGGQGGREQDLHSPRPSLLKKRADKLRMKAEMYVNNQALVCHSLVRLLALRSSGAGATVVSLNDEGVLLLRLAVHQAAGPQLALSRRTVQHHRLERRLQPLDVERTDLPWRPSRREEDRKRITQKEALWNNLCFSGT